MPLNVRAYRPEDYETIASWWPYSAPPPREVIPPSSVVVEQDGSPVGCSHVWLANAKVAIIGMTVCNSDLPPLLRVKVITAALQEAISIAKEHAYPGGVIWTGTHNRTVSRLMQRLGFKDAGAAETSYMPLGSFNTDFMEK